MNPQRAALCRRLGELVPQDSPAYAALVDIGQGAGAAIGGAQLLLACRSLYTWRRDVLGHDEAYLAAYRRAMAIVCSAEVVV